MASKPSPRKKRASGSPKATAPKREVIAEAPVAEAPIAEEPAALLRKPDFIDRVVERSGGKKKDVKPAVEAALAVLGEAIASGEELNLPPLGKLKVTRRKDAPNADILICRVRRPHNMVGGSQGDE